LPSTRIQRCFPGEVRCSARTRKSHTSLDSKSDFTGIFIRKYGLSNAIEFGDGDRGSLGKGDIRVAKLEIETGGEEFLISEDRFGDQRAPYSVVLDGNDRDSQTALSGEGRYSRDLATPFVVLGFPGHDALNGKLERTNNGAENSQLAKVPQTVIIDTGFRVDFLLLSVSSAMVPILNLPIPFRKFFYRC
jgi:hypothetical protein